MTTRAILSCILLFASLFLSKAKADDNKIEAENGSLASCEVINNSNYSGGKAVRMTENAAKLTFTLNIAKRQKHKIFVAAEGIGGQKEVRITINGLSTLFKANTYAEKEIGRFILNEGTNEVVVSPAWTYFNIDYIRTEPADDDISFDIPAQPITPQATPAALALYRFLKDNFGKRTISGMMTGSMDATDGTNIKTHEDIMAVYNVSGHYPALVGFDFMNSTGKITDSNNAWYNNYTNKVISLAKDTWNNGGIPDFTWHWRDPSRETNEFYTKKISFDFTQAFNTDGTWNTSSPLYKNIVKDIHTIADYFLELQKLNIACIFRPLHEAPGGWFWWGAKGAEPYNKLYRLIYQEMVNVKGVRNVIWDWNADYKLDNSWCPGNEYFDIVSTDIYNKQDDHSSNYPAFDQLKSLTAGKKIIALAENGPIPDIQAQQSDQAMWSWWMPWYQSWGGKFVNKTSADQWKKCMNDPHVITLENMPGWNNDR